MSLKNGLNGKTAQPLVVKEPKPEQGNVLVHMSVLAVQLIWSVVLIIQNVLARSKRSNVSLLHNVAPVYYTQCKNDDTICSGGGGESDPCEGDSPDPEEMKFCTAKMAEISDLTDAQKPWVLCSENCFVGCKLHS